MATCRGSYRPVDTRAATVHFAVTKCRTDRWPFGYLDDGPVPALAQAWRALARSKAALLSATTCSSGWLENSRRLRLRGDHPANVVFVKGLKHSVQVSRIHEREGRQVYHQMAVVIAPCLDERIPQGRYCFHVYLAGCSATVVSGRGRVRIAVIVSTQGETAYFTGHCFTSHSIASAPRNTETDCTTLPNAGHGTVWVGSPRCNRATPEVQPQAPLHVHMARDEVVCYPIAPGGGQDD